MERTCQYIQRGQGNLAYTNKIYTKQELLVIILLSGKNAVVHIDVVWCTSQDLNRSSYQFKIIAGTVCIFLYEKQIFFDICKKDLEKLKKMICLCIVNFAGNLLD